MEEPSRDANGSSEPTRTDDEDPNARERVSADRDWSSGRLSVVEADSAAAAFRPSWEMGEWSAPADPSAQPAQVVAAGTTKPFGEAPAQFSQALSYAPRKQPEAAHPKPNGAKFVPQVEPPTQKPEARAKKADAPKSPKSGKAGKSRASKSAAKTPSNTAPIAVAPVHAAPVQGKPASYPARASERPLSNAEVRAISSEITGGYPAVVVSSRPTRAIVAGVAVVLLLVVGTVWSITGSPEAASRSAPPSTVSFPDPSEEPSTVGVTTVGPEAPRTVVPIEAVAAVEAPSVAPVEAPLVETPVEAPREVRVTVRTVPENATLTLDGASVSSPILRPQDLLATTHTLEARAEGFEPRALSVRFDRDGSVRIELLRVPPATRPPAAMTPTRSVMAAPTAMAPSMAPFRITTMSPTSSSPMRASMASGAGFTTDNPY